MNLYQFRVDTNSDFRFRVTKLSALGTTGEADATAPPSKEQPTTDRATSNGKSVKLKLERFLRISF